PAAARDIAANDAFDIDTLCFLGNHDPVFQQLRLCYDIAKLLYVGMNDMVHLDIGRLLEPVSRQTVQHIAFVRHSWVKPVVERGEAVGYDDQEMLAKIVQLANLSFVNKRSFNIIDSRR